MTYPTGTILRRKTPFETPEVPNEETPDLTPFNEVEVIGNSPVQSGVRGGEWSGQLGDLLSIRPVSFGAVVDRAYGELRRDYEIVSTPPVATTDRMTIERTIPGPSPEEQFAAVAEDVPIVTEPPTRGDPAVPIVDGRRRRRTVTGPENVDE